MNFLSILQHLLFFLPYGTICIDYKLWNFCTLTLLSCLYIQLEFFEYIFQTFVNLSNWIGFRINFRIQTYYSQYIEKVRITWCWKTICCTSTRISCFPILLYPFYYRSNILLSFLSKPTFSSTNAYKFLIPNKWKK